VVHVGRKPYWFKEAFASRSIASSLYNGWVFVAVPQTHQSKVQAQSECLRSTIQRSLACYACSRSTNVGLEGQIGSRVGTASETGDPRAPCITGKAVAPTYLQWLQAIGVAEPEDKVSIAYIGV
jgi:hypothetical protein